MNRKVLFLLILVCSGLTSIFSQEDKPIITVLDFATEDVSKSEMGVIINRLSSALFQTDKYTVIDVSQRQQILNELEFSLSGCADDSCMLEVGRMLSAESIVVGSLGRIGGRIAVSLKMLETETGKTLATADEIYDDINGVVDGIPTLAAKLAGLQDNYFAVNPVTEEPDILEIAAWGSMGAGIVAAGAGVFLLAVSLPYITAYNDALTAYESAAAGADFDALRTARDAAYQDAVDNSAEANFIGGIAAIGAGVLFGAASAVLFMTPDSPADVEAALLPYPGGTMLSFTLSY